MTPIIFAVADQHGNLRFQLPKADLILHAGDICPDFGPRTAYGSSLQADWLNGPWHRWVNGSTVKACYGNHDFLRKVDGPKQIKIDELIYFDGLKIWFSPWSPEFCGWAWMRPADALKEVYDKIPAGVDIIVSHSPAYGYGDKLPDFLLEGREHEDPHVGSKELLKAVERLKPKALISGHIHSGYGIYQHGPTAIYNASLVDEAYKLVNAPLQVLL